MDYLHQNDTSKQLKYNIRNPFCVSIPDTLHVIHKSEIELFLTLLARYIIGRYIIALLAYENLRGAWWRYVSGTITFANELLFLHLRLLEAEGNLKM